jgi:hypothetical protein
VGDSEGVAAHLLKDDDRMKTDKQRRTTMQNAPPRTVFGEITDFLATNPSPEAIIAYRLPDDLQARAQELMDKNGAGELTPEERDEMFDFVRIDQMLSLLKIKMRIKLKNAGE